MIQYRPIALLFFSVALAATLAYIVREIDVEGAQDRGGAALSDFRDAFYYPGVALLDGRNPYAPIDYLNHYPVGSAYPLYSPVSLLVHLPLGLLPYRAAQAVYVAGNVLFLVLLAMLSLRLAGLRPTQRVTFIVAAALILSRPGHQNLFLGQCTFYVVAGAYMALLHARTRPWLGGVGLAVAALKPTIGAPLALLMLCRGDRRAVVIGIAVSAVVATAMLFPLLHIAGGVDGLMASLQANYAEFRSNPYVDSLTSPYRTDFVALIARSLGRPLGLLENGLLSALILATTGWVVRQQSQTGNQVFADSLICVSLLACTYHLPYDALLLTAPAVALAANPNAMGAIGVKPLYRWGSLALIAVPAASYFATLRGIEMLALSGSAWWVATSAMSAAGGLLLTTWIIAGALGNVRFGRTHAAVNRAAETHSRSCA